MKTAIEYAAEVIADGATACIQGEHPFETAPMLREAIDLAERAVAVIRANPYVFMSWVVERELAAKEG